MISTQSNPVSIAFCAATPKSLMVFQMSSSDISRGVAGCKVDRMGDGATGCKPESHSRVAYRPA